MTEVRPVRPEERAAALAVLAQCEARDPWGGHATAAEVCAQSQLFELRQGGRTVGVFALDVHHFRRGIECNVQAAAGAASIDLCAEMDAHVEALAAYQGADVLTLSTARPGLVRKLTRRGWAVSGWILRRGI